MDDLPTPSIPSETGPRPDTAEGTEASGRIGDFRIIRRLGAGGMGVA